MAIMNSKHHLNPIDRDFIPCDYTYVSLLIYCGDTSPDTISKMLGLQPTEACDKGEIVTSKTTGRSRTNKFNIWILCSENKEDSRDVRHHLDWLLERLVSRSKALHKIQAINGIEMSVRCVWWHKCGKRGGPVLWPRQMQILSALNLELVYSFYFCDEESDEWIMI